MGNPSSPVDEHSMKEGGREGVVMGIIPGWPRYMAATAEAAAEPGKLPLRRPPALALPMAVSLMGSCPADNPRAPAGCATLKEKPTAAKCGGCCFSLLSSSAKLQERQVMSDTRTRW